MFVLESLIDGALSLHNSWDQAWDYARTWVCFGGDPIGNVRLHETTKYDPSTFRSPYEPGRRMSINDFRMVQCFLG